MRAGGARVKPRTSKRDPAVGMPNQNKKQRLNHQVTKSTKMIIGARRARTSLVPLAVQTLCRYLESFGRRRNAFPRLRSAAPLPRHWAEPTSYLLVPQGSGAGLLAC